MSVCLNPGMTCPVRGKSLGNWGKASLAVAVDRWTCPVAVPTSIGGAWGFTSHTGAVGAK